MSRLQQFSLNLSQNVKVSNSFWKSADHIPILHVFMRFAARHLTLDSFNLHLLAVWSLKYTNPTNQTCLEEILLKGGQHYFCHSQSTHNKHFELQGSLLPQQTVVWKKTAILLMEQVLLSMVHLSSQSGCWANE